MRPMQRAALCVETPAPHRRAALPPPPASPPPWPPPAPSFEPDIYFNDTYGLPVGTAAPTVYQRIPATINLAVNAWLRTYLGAQTGGVQGERQQMLS